MSQIITCLTSAIWEWSVGITTEVVFKEGFKDKIKTALQAFPMCKAQWRECREMLEESTERQEMKVAITGRAKKGGNSCFSWKI